MRALAYDMLPRFSLAADKPALTSFATFKRCQVRSHVETLQSLGVVQLDILNQGCVVIPVQSVTWK